jgi:hypothetical protein
VYFAESLMAGVLGERTLLIELEEGPEAIAEGLATAAERLDADLTVFVDVGGDVLAKGDEPGLRSPLCDAVMLAAAGRLSAAGNPVLGGVFGIGCDAELSPDEVLARLSEVARAGGVCGSRGLTEPVAGRLEAAIQVVPTEASAQAVRAFRGASGVTRIRRGASSVQLALTAAQTFYLDVDVTIQTIGRLARAVGDAETLEQANDALHDLGVSTELDLERAAAARAQPSR